MLRNVGRVGELGGRRVTEGSGSGGRWTGVSGVERG
jgi:hypothetical protein